MTNFEKYRQFINGLFVQLEPLAVVNNKPTKCSIVDCNECDFAMENYCHEIVFDWLKEECAEGGAESNGGADEKQIPKKPDYEGDGYDEDGNIIYDTWYCPNCRTEYEIDYDDYQYCPNCGQRIDWDGDE